MTSQLGQGWEGGSPGLWETPRKEAPDAAIIREGFLEEEDCEVRLIVGEVRQMRRCWGDTGGGRAGSRERPASLG